MMAGNPSWWSMMMNNGMHPHEISSSTNHHHHQFVFPSLISDDPNTSTTTSNSSHHHHQQAPAAAHDQEDFPVIRSWSQLLQGGVSGGEEGGGERYGGVFEEQKKYENWELDQVFNLNNTPSLTTATTNTNRADDHVKQEASQSYGAATPVNHHEFNIHANRPTSNLWNLNDHHHQMMPLSSPNSCITTSLSCNSILTSFSGGKAEVAQGKRNRQQYQDHECDSTNGGASNKKARVQQTSSSQPVMKVRKEKLMDRITALHQIVSPFGKTDTASVLSEAIAYIRFLQSQIEALSSPYMRNGMETTGHQQHSVDSELGVEGEGLELRSRGLCLVPISSCTQHVGLGNDTIINGATAADYWAMGATGF